MREGEGLLSGQDTVRLNIPAWLWQRWEAAYGGETAGFSSFRVGSQHLNLAASPEPPARRGATRVIFYVDDVDALHAHVVGLGLRPEAPPRDATWNERYFHLTDPDGHELSFAQPLPERRAGPPP